MEKSSSFLMKNILSQKNHLQEHDNTLMVMQQMKLAYDWFERYHAAQNNVHAHAQKPLCNESHQDAVQWVATDYSRQMHSTFEMHTPSSQSTFLTNESRSMSSSSAEVEKDARAFSVCDHSCTREGPRSAFRQFVATNRPEFYPRAVVSRDRKRLPLHRIINLMVPRFHPCTPSNAYPFNNAPDVPQSSLLQPHTATQLLFQPTALNSFNFGLRPANEFNQQQLHYANDYSKAQPRPERTAETALESVEGKAEKRRKRTTFTQDQLNLLEHEFQNKKYLTMEERTAIAQTLGLSQVQIKIWWQNRRASYKRSKICQVVSSNPEDASSSNSDKQMSAFSGHEGRSKIVVPIPVHVSRRFIGQQGPTVISMPCAKHASYL